MCIFYLINLLKFTSLRMQVNVYFNSRRGNTSTFAKTFSLHCLTSAQLISQIMSVVGKAAPYTFPPLNTLSFLMWVHTRWSFKYRRCRSNPTEEHSLRPLLLFDKSKVPLPCCFYNRKTHTTAFANCVSCQAQEMLVMHFISDNLSGPVSQQGNVFSRWWGTIKWDILWYQMKSWRSPELQV